jgi:hypothetical protein
MPGELEHLRHDLGNAGASGALAIAQGLIGCSWGRGVAMADDMAPCPEQATRITVLHDGPRGYEVRLCPHHHLVMLSETDPHKGDQMTTTPTPIDEGESDAEVVISPPPLVFAAPGPCAGDVGMPLSVALEASGGTMPYEYEITGGAPAGVEVDAARIVGFPTESGAFTVDVEVTDDSEDKLKASTSFLLLVASEDAPAPPAAPVMLDPVIEGATVELTWTVIERALGTVVYQKASAEPTFTEVAWPQGVGSYLVDLERGDSYQFYVTAYNEAGQSIASNVVTVEVP